MDEARQELTWAGALGAAYAGLTAAVVHGLPLGPDVAVERALQAVPWGPAAPVFGLLDYVDGWRQVALAAAVVVAVFLLKRRLTPVAVACALSAPAYYLTQLAVHRTRPPATLVHVTRHASGYSFPSGHEVFYTWAMAVLVAALAARLPWTRVPATALALLVVATVTLSRIVVGEHWPSDCLAGLLLGGGWTLLAFGLLGERDGGPTSATRARALDRKRCQSSQGRTVRTRLGNCCGQPRGGSSPRTRLLSDRDQ